MSTGEEFETFPLDKVCELTGAPSADWLTRRITSGEVPAVLAGRDWRMTRTDMCALVDYMRAAAQRRIAGCESSPPEETPAEPCNAAGLSKRGASRMRRKTAA
jgi:hypothetical protein